MDRIPQVDIASAMDDPPAVAEVTKAVSQLSSGKVPGVDAIPAEIYKAGGPVLIEKLAELFRSFWKEGSIPQQLKDTSIVYLYKRKVHRQVCDNHRGISLLSIAGKTLVMVLLNRLVTHLELGLLPESQCGFCKGCGTTDMTFAVRNFRRRVRSRMANSTQLLLTSQKPSTLSADKACGESCQSSAAPPNSFRWYTSCMMARGLDGRESSEAFPVTNGVKQGCVLTPTLFTAMLNDAFQDNQPQVDGKLFNPRRLQAITKVFGETPSLPLTAPCMPPRSRRCQSIWTNSPRLVTTMDSPSTSKRPKSTSLLLKHRTL
ncbi:uncharacterized protein LOC132405118 [Hypanus sabinus]|uniref:uncharacterized protein LOC132405118 n=1 Tax=Hypanus sabinus TaxID=79690 RepID=UPI0028C465EE|nr:uncharacterized protein LOC132405118 [Hypanus sabinus]